MSEDKAKGGFAITGTGTGFHLTLPNNVTVSVQFAPGTYSDHYDDVMNMDIKELGRAGAKFGEPYKTVVAEVAVMRNAGTKDREWVTDQVCGCNDQVAGWRSMEEFLDILDKARAL